MKTFNRITSALFEPILAPFGGQHPWFDLVLWSFLAGLLALVVYRYASPQARIEATKNTMKAHLMEIRLFGHDIGQVFASTFRILLHNAVYMGLNLAPMLVMFLPFMILLFQLEAQYAFAPIEPGAHSLLQVQVDTDAATPLSEPLTLEVPAGVTIETPPVHTTTGLVVWRLHAQTPGDHLLRIHAGGEIFEKGLAVGGAPRRVPVLRTKTLKGFLYPGESALPASAILQSIEITYPSTELGWLLHGEFGILSVFIILSILTGLAFKNRFGVIL